MQAHDLAAHNDTILLVVIPAASCRDVSASRALKLAQDLDSDGQFCNQNPLCCSFFHGTSGIKESKCMHDYKCRLLNAAFGSQKLSSPAVWFE